MAPSLLRQLNGERTVVFLYLVRILLSVPLSLLPEAFSLSLISLLALSVEISADDAAYPLALFFRTSLELLLEFFGCSYNPWSPSL